MAVKKKTAAGRELFMPIFMRRFSKDESRRSFLLPKNVAVTLIIAAAQGGSRYGAEFVSTNFDKV